MGTSPAVKDRVWPTPSSFATHRPGRTSTRVRPRTVRPRLRMRLVTGCNQLASLSGDPLNDGVQEGDFASVYDNAATTTGFVGRVTNRTTTTITVSLTAKIGTAPTDGTGTRTLKIGGAWKGPNAADGFPLTLIAGTLTNASGDATRVNFKNNASYSITSGITIATASSSPYTVEGYATTPGDGGIATLDGGTSNITFLTFSANGTHAEYAHLKTVSSATTGTGIGWRARPSW
jgi:hypothetical protein